MPSRRRLYGLRKAFQYFASRQNTSASNGHAHLSTFPACEHSAFKKKTGLCTRVSFSKPSTLLRAQTAAPFVERAETTCFLASHFYSTHERKDISGVVEQYNRLVSEGELHHDASQEEAAQKLELLFQDIAVAVGAPQASRTSFPTGGSSPESSTPEPVRGVYLWGGVGTGKTMLMDTFVGSVQALLEAAQNPQTAPGSDGETGPASSTAYPTASAPASASPPQMNAPPPLLLRLHFHEFMAQKVHKELHRIQNQRPKHVVKTAQGKLVYRSHSASSPSPSSPSPSSSSAPATPAAVPELSPLDQVSLSLARSCRVLCLDELHVTDVADAMVLSRLLGNLLHLGVRVVFTSNSPPSELYKGGLSRHYFLPFVRQVQNGLLVAEVAAAGKDFRVQNAAAAAAAASSTSVGSSGSQAWSDAAAVLGNNTLRSMEGASASRNNATLSAFGNNITSLPQSPSAIGQRRSQGQSESFESLTPLWIIGDGVEAERRLLNAVFNGSTDGSNRNRSEEAGEAVGKEFHTEDVPSAYGRRLRCERVLGDTVVLDFEELCGGRGLRSVSSHSAGDESSTSTGGAVVGSNGAKANSASASASSSIGDGSVDGVTAPSGSASGSASLALSASDYIALCNRFPRIVITGLRQFAASHSSDSSTSPSKSTMEDGEAAARSRDSARRLVSFLDMASQQGTRLMVSSDVAPGEIFSQLSHRLDVEIAEMEAQRRLEVRRRRREREQRHQQQQHHQQQQKDQEALAASSQAAAPSATSTRDPPPEATAGVAAQALPQTTAQATAKSMNSEPQPAGPIHMIPGPSAMSQPAPGDDLAVPTSLKHEERLMYRRATSRLLGLCPHVQVLPLPGSKSQ